MTSTALPIERLGSYRLLERLGTGGMGTVYLAHDEEREARVALKVLHPHVVERPGALRRFHREARAGERIHHPNVVPALDLDLQVVQGEPWHFLVMEYVEGQTLRGLLDELEIVPEVLVREIGRQVAAGLAAIHDAGLIHRDVKPENVMLTAAHEVRIMDLGIARLQTADLALTAEGRFVGSLLYAAPEQLLGKPLTPSADLYALGETLYELATGRHPLGEDDRNPGVASLLHPRFEPAGRVNPALSPFLEELLHGLLAEAPGERPESAELVERTLAEGEDGTWWRRRAQTVVGTGGAPPRRIRVPRETALHGRDGELARLGALFEQASSGDGAVLLLEGEAGIGKSRLIDELLAELAESDPPADVIFATQSPGERLLPALGTRLGAAGSKAYLRESPAVVPAFDALLRDEPAPEGAPALTPDSLATCLVRTVQALARARPVVVVVEDLHAADDEQRARFLALARATAGHRVLLLGTARPGLPPAWTAELLRPEHVQSAALPRLGARELQDLLADALRSPRLAEELGGRIATKTDGVPYFVFEVLRDLRERGLLRRRKDGTWDTTGTRLETIRTPPRVQELIGARLERLDDEQRALLDVASCWGFAFDPALVAEAAGVGRVRALRRLARIERVHGLVRPSGRRLEFDHHQVQEVLHDALLVPLREEYHVALADALAGRTDAAETDVDSLDGALCVDLCEHYLHGARGETALRYLDRALTHLEKGYQLDRAIALAEHALSAPDLLEGEKRVEILVRVSRRWNFRGRYEEAKSHGERALALAREIGHRQLETETTQCLGSVFRDVGRYEEAMAHNERALALALEIGDRSNEAGALADLGLNLTTLSRNEEAKAHLERALAICREIGHRQFEANATLSLGWVFGNLGRYEEAKAHEERARAFFREIGDRRGEGLATGNLGVVSFRLGRYEEAKAQFERHLALAREIGDRRGEATATQHVGALFFALRRYEEAKTHHQRALTLAREIGNRHGEACAVMNLGSVLCHTDHYAEAKAQFERALALFREIGDRKHEATATGNLGNVFANLGRHEEAKAHYERALALAREIGDRQGEVSSVKLLGNTLRRLGHYAAAKAHNERALALAREIGDCPGEAGATEGLGNAFFSLGRYEEAKAQFERHLALAREIGDRQGEAIALVNLGWVRALLGEPDRARTELEQSLSICGEIGHRLCECYGLLNLGQLADEEEHVEEARRLTQQSLARLREIGHGDGVADSLLFLGDLERRAGRLEEARAALEEALELCREQGRKPELAQALTLLACLPSGDAAAAEKALREAGDAGNTPDIRFHLWKATGKHEHLAEARRLLDFRVEHAPAESRTSMLQNVRLHREIMEAWQEDVGDA